MGKSKDEKDEDLPAWCSAGSHFPRYIESPPGEWQGKPSGQWKRKELEPYGRANEAYREKYFVCPECNCSLQPHQEQEYRFYCEGCYLVWHWSSGSLSGYGSESSKAEFLNP